MPFLRRRCGNSTAARSFGGVRRCSVLVHTLPRVLRKRGSECFEKISRYILERSKVKKYSRSRFADRGRLFFMPCRAFLLCGAFSFFGVCEICGDTFGGSKAIFDGSPLVFSVWCCVLSVGFAFETFCNGSNFACTAFCGCGWCIYIPLN